MQIRSITSAAAVLEPTSQRTLNTIRDYEHFAATIYAGDMERVSGEQKVKATIWRLDDSFGHGPNYRGWGINE